MIFGFSLPCATVFFTCFARKSRVSNSVAPRALAAAARRTRCRGVAAAPCTLPLRSSRRRRRRSPPRSTKALAAALDEQRDARRGFVSQQEHEALVARLAQAEKDNAALRARIEATKDT